MNASISIYWANLLKFIFILSTLYRKRSIKTKTPQYRRGFNIQYAI